MARCWLASRRAQACAVLGFVAMTTACASSGAVPRPFPTPQGPRTGQAQGSLRAGDRDALVEMALSLRGVPYRKGGATPTGFDCSGFTQYVFSRNGVTLPRDAREQFEVGESVNAQDVAPGDLLFFTTIGPGPTHVAIAVSSDQFVHAPSSTGVVRVERLGTSYWSARYLGARRLTRL